MKYKVSTGTDMAGRIVQDTTSGAAGVAQQVCRRVIDVQEQQIRDTLISLGWTPPGARARADMADELAAALRFYRDADKDDGGIRAASTLAKYDALKEG